MDTVLFNFHDLILMMTALQCLFFAVLLVATNTQKMPSTYFLAAFLLAHAFIPLHEMMLWGAEFKLTVREHAPQLYFWGGFAYYLDGALLYFCVKSLLFRDFHFKRLDALHLVPLLLFALFMWLSFYRLPGLERLALINSEAFVYGGPYVVAELLSKVLRVAYALACLWLIVSYKKRLQSTHSNIGKVDTNWVTTLVVGFLMVMLVEVVLAVAKIVNLYNSYDLSVFSNIGLTGYYTVFILVNLLAFTGIRYFASFEKVRQREAPKKPLDDHFLNPEVAEQIDERMRRDKPFLQPDITLDHLAEELQVPARDLSMLINRHFGINFYEFINRYRIEEAQQRLLSPENKDKTITDIYLDVGFNSKSVFNTFFKKMVGVTPSQFRREGEL
ncbi:AraC family transcriptional regulator [Gilvimarinus algae]|uniref:Helix-turn-helix domain-containing protein n=1 Tax=Gilvimarinus algae TaxID=3058037 RepID=A0ABT8TM63_9GAMM|nr:helix-turn-helix domain-containing protein [Gilvimarinus sp. SDUM040014]MDO3383726.1 helix-turn-helix domain-containing protein [Gilvimarinus sp. SDUM040014]